MKEQKGSTRIAWWDNIKAILIFLVVLGHISNPYVSKSASVRILYTWIYMFHMPLFVFLTGMFSRSTVETGHKLKQRAVGYVILGFLLKFSILFVQLLFGRMKTFSVWKEQGVAWYMFCLAAWLVLTWLLRKIPRLFLLVVSVIFACFVGYDKSVEGFLALSRFFVFYPFFLLGTCRDPAKPLPETGSLIRKAAAACCVALSVFLVIRHPGFFYKYIDLFKGWKSYIAMTKSIGETGVACGALLRLGWYVAASILSASVALLVPAGKSFLTGIGKRTLQIYLYHRPILYIMMYTHLDRIVRNVYRPHWRLLYLMLSIVLTFLLSLPLLERPLQWFWKQLEKV